MTFAGGIRTAQCGWAASSHRARDRDRQVEEPGPCGPDSSLSRRRTDSRALAAQRLALPTSAFTREPPCRASLDRTPRFCFGSLCASVLVRLLFRSRHRHNHRVQDVPNLALGHRGEDTQYSFWALLMGLLTESCELDNRLRDRRLDPLPISAHDVLPFSDVLCRISASACSANPNPRESSGLPLAPGDLAKNHLRRVAPALKNFPGPNETSLATCQIIDSLCCSGQG